MKLYCRTFCAYEHEEQGSFGMIDLTPGLIAQIQLRYKALETIREKDSNVWEIMFASHDAILFNACGNTCGEKYDKIVDTLINNFSWIILDQEIPEIWFSRTEDNCMVISTFGDVYFKCRPRYGDIDIETQNLKISELTGILAGTISVS